MNSPLTLPAICRSARAHVVLAAVATIAAIVVLPQAAPLYTLINVTLYLSMGVFALSLALLWGYGGILCFGQSAFFGLGAYAYAIAAINFGDTTLAAAMAMLVPAIFAAGLGYFLFYGRLNDVYLGVITLTVTLILFKLINSTGGDARWVGAARLCGSIGIPNTPLLRKPFNGATRSPAHMLVIYRVALHKACSPPVSAVPSSPCAKTRCAPSCSATTPAA